MDEIAYHMAPKSLHLPPWMTIRRIRNQQVAGSIPAGGSS